MVKRVSGSHGSALPEADRWGPRSGWVKGKRKGPDSAQGPTRLGSAPWVSSACGLAGRLGSWVGYACGPAWPNRPARVPPPPSLSTKRAQGAVPRASLNRRGPLVGLTPDLVWLPDPVWQAVVCVRVSRCCACAFEGMTEGE
jgi:hypothetical protein